MTPAAKELAINFMLEDLRCVEGDVEIHTDDDGEKIALIPYFSHGKMRAHKIPLEVMAESVHSALIATTNQ